MTTTDGEYGGLGLNVTMEDGAVKVIAADRGQPRLSRPASRPATIITHLNGKLIYGGTLDEAVDQMRGPPGTSIKVTIVRPGRDKPFDVTLTRAIIELPAVKWEVKDHVGIINVNSFSRTTTDETLAAIASDREVARPAAARLYRRPALQSGRPARPGGRPLRRLPRARRGRLAARPQEERHRALLRPARATPPAACRSSSWSIPAAPRRPRSSPRALQDHHRAARHGRAQLRQGLGPDPAPADPADRAPAHHRALLHAVGPSVQEGGITPDIEVPQLSDPDYKDAAAASASPTCAAT